LVLVACGVLQVIGELFGSFCFDEWKRVAEGWESVRSGMFFIDNARF